MLAPEPFNGHTSLTVVPAYGRSYKNKEQIEEDFEGNKDFYIASFFASGYINKSDCFINGIKQLKVRYGKNKKVHIIYVSEFQD